LWYDPFGAAPCIKYSFILNNLPTIFKDNQATSIPALLKLQLGNFIRNPFALFGNAGAKKLHFDDPFKCLLELKENQSISVLKFPYALPLLISSLID
jgi:hypothetical protein